MREPFQVRITGGPHDGRVVTVEPYARDVYLPDEAGVSLLAMALTGPDDPELGGPALVTWRLPIRYSPLGAFARWDERTAGR